MHYANGRPAKNGDTVLQMMYGKPTVGVLYDAKAGNDYCNGMLAPLPGGQHVGACLADCVHWDDVLSVLNVDAKSGDVRKQLSLLVPFKDVEDVGLVSDVATRQHFTKIIMDREGDSLIHAPNINLDELQDDVI